MPIPWKVSVAVAIAGEPLRDNVRSLVPLSRFTELSPLAVGSRSASIFWLVSRRRRSRLVVAFSLPSLVFADVPDRHDSLCFHLLPPQAAPAAAPAAAPRAAGAAAARGRHR